MEIFEEFYNNRNEEQAGPMAKYMKNLFPFLGLKKPERKFQYLAIDYMEKVVDLFIPGDMEKVEKLLTTKSWWDSVDAINKIVGHIAMKYPEVKEEFIVKWIGSDNIWLNRITIIFQLKYKEETDREFLTRAILSNSQTEEFFINKAIGWALREYSKTNRLWVKDFIENNKLSKLSVREGSKYI